MYSLVVTVAIAAILALLRQLDRAGAGSTVPAQRALGGGGLPPPPTPTAIQLRHLLVPRGAWNVNLRRSASRGAVSAAVILLHWFLLGLHYYSALLVVAEGIFCLAWLLAHRAPMRRWLLVGGTLGLAVAPLLLWLALAPGFHDTLRMILADPTPKPDGWHFLQSFWRELSFASVRWAVVQSSWGYLWLPLVVMGIVAVLWPLLQQDATMTLPKTRLSGFLPLLAALLPIGLSALFFPSLATRYLLYVVPFLLLLMAWGIGWLGRWHWTFGLLGLALALVVPVRALPHYYGPYQKSEYRAMTRYLQQVRRADEALLLEAPRQHLLTKYYLPADLPLYTAPAIDLPPFWPVNAPPVVPEAMDDVIQALLRDYRGVWLSLTAENEVDPGEFVPKYLTAVAYEADCDAWLDVRLCHYLSPPAFPADMTAHIDITFADDLSLQRADLALPNAPALLLVTLHWQARQIPLADYRVTLRLVDESGATVSQRDNYPIGPLLPPTTWQAGDEKPGYMALPLPTTLSAGVYPVTVNLYDPADGRVVAHGGTENTEGTEGAENMERVVAAGQDGEGAVVLGVLVVGDGDGIAVRGQDGQGNGE